MKLLKPISLLLSLAIIALIGFKACDTASGPSTGMGELTVKLTDAPVDYDAVWIDIQSVRIHRNGNAETDTTESDEEAENEGWITILDEPMRVNLLDLRNGNEITLGDTLLETGTYSQLRFILGDDNEVVIDGQSHDLKTPSAQQSGLKLNLNVEIEDGQSYTLLIDFDAARSVVETGNGKYILKPVLRAVNLEATGSISGVVEPNDFTTEVMAIEGEDTLSTITGEDGAYAFLGVHPGTYDLNFDPSDTTYADTTLTGIEVIAGEETVVDTLRLNQN